MFNANVILESNHFIFIGFLISFYVVVLTIRIYFKYFFHNDNNKVDDVTNIQNMTIPSIQEITTTAKPVVDNSDSYVSITNNSKVDENVHSFNINETCFGKDLLNSSIESKQTTVFPDNSDINNDLLDNLKEKLSTANCQVLYLDTVVNNKSEEVIR